MDDAEPQWIAVFFLWMQVQTLLFHSAVGKQRELGENLLQIKAWKAREINDRWTFSKYFNWFFEKHFQWVWGVTWVSLPVPAGSAEPSCPCYLQVGLGLGGQSPAHPSGRHSQLQSHSEHLWSKLKLCVGDISTGCRQEHCTHTSEHCPQAQGHRAQGGRCRLSLASFGGLNRRFLSGMKRMVSEWEQWEGVHQGKGLKLIWDFRV